MKCNKCNNEVSADSKFCPFCGATVETAKANSDDERTISMSAAEVEKKEEEKKAEVKATKVEDNPINNDRKTNTKNAHNGSVTFGEAIKLFFENYVNFEGRASKSEYWWAFLFQMIVSVVASFIPVVSGIVSLAILLPNLSISIRRLHDIGKPWYWYLLGLIPFAGFIIMIVLYTKDSDGTNQWGPGPY